MKYVIYIDYLAETRKLWDYRPIDAKTLEEAIETADKLWDPDEMYLIRIMKKSSKVVTPYHAGYKYEEYTAIMCKRSTIWRRNIAENCEGEQKVNKCWLTSNKDEVWFEAV